MSGIVKSVAKIFGGGKSAPTIMQSAAPAPSAPAASAASAAESTAAAGPTATVGSQTGSLGVENAKKSSRRRGRLETLLTDLGGTVERFGD